MKPSSNDRTVVDRTTHSAITASPGRRSRARASRSPRGGRASSARVARAAGDRHGRTPPGPADGQGAMLLGDGSYNAIHPPRRPVRPPRGPWIKTDAALDAHLRRHRRGPARRRTQAFLRIPSISAIPAHADDCRRAAELAGRCADDGRAGARRGRRDRRPSRRLRRLAPRRRTPRPSSSTGHYDVQPVDPLELWTSPPFEPVVVGDRMLARGAADDKGQIHAHVMAAGAPAGDRGQAARSTLDYLFEGEEESSSVHLDAWLAANRERLAGGRRDHQRHRASSRATCRPSRVSLRGIMYAQIDVVGHGRRPPFGRLRRASSRTRPTPWPRSSPGSRAPTAGSGSRASTTTSCR